MATSCVAEEKATSRAAKTTAPTPKPTSATAIPIRPTAIPHWASSIQERRRPSARVSSGIGSRSTTGAQKTLME